jgi:alpha-1,3/alpha-1,6-mannosyltransferase
MKERKEKKRQEVHHIVFIHLDLGIGGAEQLVLQLATASQNLGYQVDIVTTRCDQDHCFASVQRPNGQLSSCVYVYGRWIPSNIMGVGTAFMSTLRMLYITYQVIRQNHHQTAHVVVMDVLPTSIPLVLKWMSSAGILFYCHFPDKLLLQRNQQQLLKQQRGILVFQQWYRTILDAMEESTMALADTLVVNSNFTLSQVRQHFTTWTTPPPPPTTTTTTSTTTTTTQDIRILYPALDTSTMVQANHQKKINQSPIVSLNRFERKKNIGLLIEAYAYMTNKRGNSNNNNNINKVQQLLPPLIVAGGYDPQNVENVEYRGELGELAKQLDVPVDFRLDISDMDRANLFQTALCVVYTPDQEHFGIVPLEAMYAGTPVLAVNTGGPTETIRDGVTGFLRNPTAKEFGEALLTWIDHPELATQMGIAGRKHVDQTFGPQRFQQEWQELVESTIQKAILRQANTTTNRRQVLLWWNHNIFIYILEAILMLLLVLLLTWLARETGILQPNQSIWGKIRLQLQPDEL